MSKKDIIEAPAEDANLPMDLKAEMERRLARLKDQTGEGSTSAIKIARDGSCLEIPGRDAAGPTATVIVLDAINRKEYYPGKFNPNKIVPPRCYALGHAKHNELVASQGSEEIMCPKCADCELNVYEKDSPKDCKDMVWLAVVAPDDPEGEILVVKVSPTGLKYWRNHVKTVQARFKMDPLCCYTELRIAQAGNSDRKTFGFGIATYNGNQRVPLEALQKLIGRSDETTPVLEREYEYEKK